jgi:transcriptional regulator with XRE-family HTH domain
MNLADRIKAAREHAQLTQIDLSKKVGLPQQTISKLENGLQQETAAIVKIATACGVDPLWLDTGTGEMFKYTKDDLIAIEIARGLSAQEKRAWYRAGRALAEPDEGTNGTK